MYILLRDKVVDYEAIVCILGCFDDEHIEEAQKHYKEKYPGDDVYSVECELNEYFD